MRYGIIGININTAELNYGAVLHCWAFQKMLKGISDNVEVEVINYDPSHNGGLNVKYPFWVSLKKGHEKYAIKTFLIAREYATRYEKLKVFNQKQFKISERYKRDELAKATLKYDCIIVESDVVWKKIDNGKFDPVFFLALPSMKNMPRIAYGPDTADLRINDDQTKEELTELLRNIDVISCRGKAPLDILQQCTDKEVTPVLDPTLCIDKTEYDKISASRIVKTPYCLCYYIDYDNEMYEKCRTYSKQHGLKMVTLTSRIGDFKTVLSLNRKTYAMGVEEFVSLIKYADVIFTNSFHGICVSMQYEKEFYAYPRVGEQKVLDLCHDFNLDSHYIEKKELPATTIDYTMVKRIWKEKKEASICWLQKALRESKRDDE